MKYVVAEKFKSVQGEGLYAGTPMAFIRFVGCSVGKKICHHCDTIFEKTLPWQGGGEFSPHELLHWAYPYKHICLTGGEPLDQDVTPLINHSEHSEMFHLETSGTKSSRDVRNWNKHADLKRVWICVSPKPGFLEEEVLAADEVKVIVPGLGTDESLRKMVEFDVTTPTVVEGHLVLGQGRVATMQSRNLYWPKLEDALRWEKAGKLVYLQPQNERHTINNVHLMYVMDLLKDYPQLRLSNQLHKILKVQ